MGGMSVVATSAAPIDKVSTRAGNETVGLAWTYRGRARPVRLLRSAEWFPASPYDHLAGHWAAELAGDDLRDGFAETGLEPEQAYYYSLFVRHGREGWYDPVNVKVWTVASHHAGEVYGGRPRGPAVSAATTASLAAETVLPALFVVTYAMVLLLASGPGYRFATAALLATVALWRAAGEPERELQSFLRWLVLPFAASVIVTVGILWFDAFATWLAPWMTASVDPHWLLVPALPLATLGMWLAASYTLAAPLRDDRLWRVTVLLGPALVALLLPNVALVGLLIAGALLWRAYHVALAGGSRAAVGAAGAAGSVGPAGAALTTIGAGAPASVHAPASATADAGRSELFWQLLTLWVLNLCDLALTTKALALGVALEANSVMGFFLEHGPLVAAAFKLGAVTGGVALLWRLRRHRSALTAARIVTALYAVIVLYQLLWWVGLV